MTVREKRRQRRHNHAKSKTETEDERRARLEAKREERARHRAAAQSSGLVVVHPFVDWCQMRGISVATGRRLIAKGAVKAVQLSERRIGVTPDDDRQYLANCLREPAS
jgi:hypothetical protein